ncbi:MAG: hypothetical protein A2X56_09680 [Nitrospirae bacterium GWC2_57_13]|nr:MAG: hypothetical protein A2X56_09680 [Nitrospirae bacterium GWC2_57_13]
MKFIADAMLGKLAKRLRLLGYDVLYDPSYDDNEIIRLSLEQDRVILTRDTGLVNRPTAKNHLFITSDDPGEQVRQVIDAFGLTTGPEILTRCSVCNTLLIMFSKQMVRDRVPDHVYQTNNDFQQCKQCDKIYWIGTHIKTTSNATTKARHK